MDTLNGRTVLIADDERYVTTTLAAKLQAAGAQVIVASDGAEAFAAACAHHPHLVLSDFQMPIVSGLQLAMNLKSEPVTSSIPVIMLTARGHKLLPSELALTNIRAVLAKPFSVREVLEQVCTICKQRAA